MHGVLRMSFVAVLAVAAGAPGEDSKPPKEEPKVARERVKGSIHHHPERVWLRIAGKVKVIDARTLEFADGTRVMLTLVAPDLMQMGRIDGKFYPCGREAAGSLRKLIGAAPVMAFGKEGEKLWKVYMGDTNLEHAMVINGWALAHHSSLHAAEVIARENKRGLWRGEFVDPAEWRKGKRLPGEK